MTNPICPECRRLGTGHSEFQTHTIMITENGECPACGFCVPEGPVWCRVCEIAVATEPGQLCEGCAGAIGAYEVTAAEIDRLPEITPPGVICGFKADPEDDTDYDRLAEAFYGW